MFEAKLVVQSLRINTSSKLTFSDSNRFDGLLRDVFPGVEFKDIEYEALAESIRTVCKDSNLVVNEGQVETTVALLSVQYLSWNIVDHEGTDPSYY